LNKTDKILIIFFIILATSLVTGTLYVRSTFDPEVLEYGKPLPLSKIKNTLLVEVEQEKIFQLMADVEKYPLVLPNNVISVDIVNQYNNTIIAYEELTEVGVKINLKVKHTLYPFNKHTIEILEGDAKNTNITLTFVPEGSSTWITTEGDVQLHGILTPFSFLSGSSVSHALDTAIVSFEKYSHEFETNEQKIVDDIYREILHRPADSVGLEHYSSLLREGKITEDKLRETLLNSDEFKTLLLPEDTKSIDELEDETKKSVDKIYQELLNRSVDPRGLLHFGNLLESGKISEEDLRQMILKSDEYKSMESDNP